jgi:hypothetical protein
MCARGQRRGKKIEAKTEGEAQAKRKAKEQR